MSKASPLAAYLIGSLVLFAAGGCVVVTQRANFLFGGDDYNPRRGIPVDATGLDAIAIGTAIIGAGVLNLAQGIRDRRRIAVFWLGAALFLTPVLYGLSKAALAVYQLIVEIRSSG